MPEPTIAAGFARALMELAAAKGADRKDLAARSGIALAELEDQDNRIAFAKYKVLMRAAQERTGDPALALHFGEAHGTAEMSIIGLMLQACETYAEAFEQLSRFGQLIVDVPVNDPQGRRLVLERIGGKVWMIDTRKDPNDFPELTESSFARMAGVSRRGGRAALVAEIHVTHDPPAYRDEYSRVFAAPVIFGSERNALLMADERFLETRFPNPSRYAFGVFSEKAEALLKSLEGAKSVRGRVEGLLLPSLHKGDPDLDAIAAKLAMSRQTLYRNLKAEGTSFAAVVDYLRHRMAVDYLRGRRLSVNEAAYLTGFSEPSAFSRAFKRWTGTPPRQFRGSAQADNA